MLRRIQEAFEPNDDGEREQKLQAANADREYTEDLLCEFCGTELDGAAFQCAKCGFLICSSCICQDGSCAACAGLGKPDLPEA
jgi:hypothetical protein